MVALLSDSVSGHQPKHRVGESRLSRVSFDINESLVIRTMAREGIKGFDSYFNYIVELGYKTKQARRKVEDLSEISKVRKILDGIPMCPKCNSLNAVKHGVRNLRQRWRCKDCKRTFSV